MVEVDAVVIGSRKKPVRRRVLLPHTGQAPDHAARDWAKQQPFARVVAVRKDGTPYVWN
jgi:hypothetical protein